MPSRTYDIYITVPPDGGYSWVIAFITFFGFIIADGIGSSFYLLRERIMPDLEVTESMAATIGSVYSSLCLFLGPITSALCNLYGFRWLLIAGGILTASGVGLTYFSKNYILTVALFGVLSGIGGGCALISLTAPVGYWFDKRRPIAIGLSSSGAGIGMVLVPYTTGFLMKTVHWKWAYIYHSALFSCYIFLGLFLIPLTPLLLKADIPPATAKEKTIQTNKLKANNKHHSHASELFPPSSLQAIQTDRRIHSSALRGLQKAEERSSYDVGILPRPSDSLTSELFWSQHIIQKLCICCRKQKKGHRPLYKTDIFYQGSIFRLEQLEKMETPKAIDYAMSVTKLPTKKDIAEEEAVCVCCPEAIRRIINTMFDFSVMKNTSFLLFLLSNFFFTMGSALPNLYICNQAKINKMPDFLINWLVPCIGFGVFFGRIFAGVLLQVAPFIKAFHICFCVILAIILLTVGLIFLQLTIYYFVYTSTFGIFFGIFTSIRSLILVDYLGLEQLTTSTGILFAFGGAALLIGSPVAALLKEFFNDNSAIFYFAGGLMTLSLILLGPMPFCNKTKQKK